MPALFLQFSFALVVLLLCGCKASYYKKSADKEVQKIIQSKQQQVFGKTNAFEIGTEWSNRKPDDVKAQDLLDQRFESAKTLLTLTDALRVATEKNRQYQLRKENLYLSALTLTRERYQFRPQFFASSTVSGNRASNGDKSGSVDSRVGVDQLLKTGGSIGVNIANDLLRFYTGDPRKSAVSAISVNLVQPLLRGAGAKIAAENLTQAERNVIYEIRDFSHYQNTFAVDIVSTYLRLLQQQDAVRNEYNNYESLVRFRERAEDLAVDRWPRFQVDQAKQDELRARSRYILAVERYQNSLDQFKVTLGLPIGHDIRLDDQALKDMETLGLAPVSLAEDPAYQLALQRRLDLLNEIDKFEDSKRKIHVAANRLRPDLNIFADVSLQSERPTDYSKFDLNDYRAGAGLQLNLPLDRLLERNSYRSSLLSFERQIRSLTLFIDDVRSSVREGLRTLDQARQTYEIQRNARDLAERRVESSELSLQAGRAEVRDVLEAQTARLQAFNAVTQSIVDYHLTRLRLLLDMGVLKTENERFWMEDSATMINSPDAPATPAGPVAPTAADELITPDKLFQKQP